MRRMLDILAFVLSAAVATAAVTARAQTPADESPAEDAARVWLWPGEIAPGSERIDPSQSIVERSTDPAAPDRIITGVNRPYLVVYRPARPSGAALLVTPGGGYQRIVLDKEGTALLPAFVEEAGLTLFVLRYRLPGDGHQQSRDAPLADAQRALRLIRARAGEWKIDPQRIGVMGFSAGGHVAASLGTRFGERGYAPVDTYDRTSARPDFMLLIYPVIDMGERIAHPGSRMRLLGASPTPGQMKAYSLQHQVTAATPPTFLLHANDDDVVPVENSLVFFDALRREGVPAELHVYPQGGHGFGIRGTRGLPVAEWPRLALDWMASLARQRTDQPK